MTAFPADRRRILGLARPLVLVLSALAAAYVWMVGNIPYVALASATYDDAHFVKLAAYLLNGQWLGPYDETTLIKGPFFSMWIAGAWLLNLPLFQSEAILYAVAGILLLAAVRPCFRHAWPMVPLYAVLLMNPMVWDGQLQRIMRETLYAPLTLTVIALAAWAFGRQDRRGSLAWALLLGLVFGCFWLTREEGVWLLPTMGLLWLALWLRPRPSSLPRPTGPERLTAAVAVTVMSAVGFAVPYGGVLALNRHVYGVANTVEFKQTAFLDAYGALTRVQPETAPRHVPVAAATLAKIATVSPSLAQLMPSLQSRRADWAVTGCAAYGVEPCDGEWRGGWFMWALRNAVGSAGYYASASTASAFYQRLADEVNLACLDGRLVCGPRRASLAPPFQRDDIAPTLEAFRRGLDWLVHMAPSGRIPASIGAPYYLQLFFDLVEGPHLPAGPTLILRARLLTPGTVETVAVSDQGRGYSEIQLRPMTDAPADAKGRLSTRLDLQTGCTGPDCRVFLSWHGGHLDLPLAAISAPGRVEQDGIVIETDLSRDTDIRPILPSVERGRLLLKSLGHVAHIYGAALPWLVALAAASLLFQLVTAVRQRQADLVLLVQLALWAGIVVRLALLSALDALMMPGINNLYLAPLYPMMLAAIGLALWRGGEQIAQLLPQRRPATKDPLRF